MENRETNYLLAIINPMLLEPSFLKVERVIDEKGVLLTLSVHKLDMGRVIGREGQTAQAIRILLRQFGGTIRSNISLKINEPAPDEPRDSYQEGQTGLGQKYRPLHETFPS